MAEKSKRKKDCWHYWRNACKVLECLVCEERDCSFYETEEEYIKRQKEFREKYKPNEMTLLADCVFLNISPDLWSYKSDYFDPFEDPDTQWQRLVEAKNNGAAEREDLIKWQWATLTDDEIKEKKERIIAEEKNNSNKSIESMLNM